MGECYVMSNKRRKVQNQGKENNAKMLRSIEGQDEDSCHDYDQCSYEKREDIIQHSYLNLIFVTLAIEMPNRDNSENYE